MVEALKTPVNQCCLFLSDIWVTKIPAEFCKNVMKFTSVVVLIKRKQSISSVQSLLDPKVIVKIN